MKIHRIANVIGIPFLAEIDMRHLSQRIDTGVGAPGAVHSNTLAGKSLDRRGQRALNGRAVVLHLPADIRPAVIFDGELVARHQGSTLAGAIGVPRRNSSAAIGLPPARCSSTMRTAPLPQATVSLSSSTRPDSPLPLPLVECRIFTRPVPGSSHHAPGNGESPRQ